MTVPTTGTISAMLLVTYSAAKVAFCSFELDASNFGGGGESGFRASANEPMPPAVSVAMASTIAVTVFLGSRIL
ncbi:hypothetical protein C8F04DRAFT_1102688 [Mycena alexandri]|uniref:Uncharacterized protein n=1 Tax=Mycena alexandri TaxID=1745969 RepID=A0AAD6SV39_9AGAR|nr:hypothetical protein C8F04DRAFT_1102688 [Mycena alexandri]